MNPQQLSGLLVPLVFVVIFYFLLIRPQQKREKALKNMRESLKVGNEVVTIGGIVGKIIKINEESVTVEIGADKTKIVFEKWGIAKVKP
ncbi:preprotein translocase subunit YajC [Acetoanaerobium pronyense]|uniref:Preprotein translocase subunit YajC n=1 Tax=Acetoanaerobium pronyense TaxID=1482736 RepID=A0ABS4KIN6_9FIRM|nr:preprotein translocase subunit YajC [Acetoanaerobium pronyense]MBP2027624.1 preprotein translocase subunit YajC [Acetoanaerobium pronyense]